MLSGARSAWNDSTFTSEGLCRFHPGSVQRGSRWQLLHLALPENKGRYYHDGRFATLLDVVNHYNQVFNLQLTEGEKRDLVEYLKSL